MLTRGIYSSNLKKNNTKGKLSLTWKDAFVDYRRFNRFFFCLKLQSNNIFIDSLNVIPNYRSKTGKIFTEFTKKRLSVIMQNNRELFVPDK